MVNQVKSVFSYQKIKDYAQYPFIDDPNSATFSILDSNNRFGL